MKNNYTKSTIIRFWLNIRKTDNCWEWKLGKDKDGYGIIAINGKKTVRIHRLSYEINIGEIPEKMCVLHRCDNPSCANPNHLFLGKAKENAIDMVAKGRSLVGEKNHKSKLKNGDIFQIREMYDKKNISETELAKMFNVTQGMIGFIVRRESWTHI